MIKIIAPHFGLLLMINLLSLNDPALQAGSEIAGKIPQENKISGTLTPVGPPDTAPVRIDAGESCIVDLIQTYTISGNLSGTVVFNYRILVKGPCGSPIGTYDEEWIAHGKFDGEVNGNIMTGMMSYLAKVEAGGEVDGQIVMGQGISGNLHVTGNFEDGKLSYTGMLK